MHELVYFHNLLNPFSFSYSKTKLFFLTKHFCPIQWCTLGQCNCNFVFEIILVPCHYTHSIMQK